MTTYKSINNNTSLVELKSSDYEIVDDEPNVIGWDVKNTKGKKIGEVDDLLFDPESNKVRYLVIDMEDNDLDLENERRVLIPIGVAVLYETYDDVILPDITVDQLADLPPYDSDTFNYTTENEIRQVFTGKTVVEEYRAPDPEPDTTQHKAQFYEHDHFNDTKFYGERRAATEQGTVTPGEEIVPVNEQPSIDNSGTAVRNEDIIVPVTGETVARPVKVEDENTTSDGLHVSEEYLADKELKRQLEEDQRRHNRQAD